MEKNAVIFSIICVLGLFSVSALVVDADYVVLYPGEEETIRVELENTEDYDVEDVSFSLDLEGLPFVAVGSSERSVDEIDDGDEESVSFTLRASTEVSPGDYNIPYEIKYTNKEDGEEFEKEGSFGLRVGAKTELSFSADAQGDQTEVAILGRKGQIDLEIINRGLGDIKSVYVQLLPRGFELLSKEKVFIGNIDSEDSDITSFDVIFTSKEPKVIAQITYKDFDNEDQTESVDIPLEVYTLEEASKLGLVSQGSVLAYVLVAIFFVVLIFWWRRRRKKKNKRKSL